MERKRTLLIADDEELIRQGIIARLDYLKLKPSVVFEAEGAVEAMEILSEHHVDIVITDIRMADMDGLALIRAVKPLYPGIEFIVISGYAEFEYAEQAIHLGVNAYLLKPISNDALKKSMEEVLKRLEEREEQQQALREGQRLKEKNKDYLFEKVINDMLNESDGLMEVDRLRDFDCGDFFLKGRFILLAIINIDGDSYEQQCFECKDIDLIKFSINNVLNELPSQCQKVVVNNLGNRNQLYAMISHEKKDQLRVETEKLFTSLSNVMWKKLKVSLTFGISLEASDTLKDCKREASEAFMQRLVHGNSSLYFYEDMKMLTEAQFPVSELNMLRRYIERHDLVNIEIMIQAIFSDENIMKYHAAYVRVLWARVIHILLTISNPAISNDPKKVDRLVSTHDLFSSFQTMDELRSKFYQLIQECIQVNSVPDGNARNRIRMSLKYIEDNYNRDISVNELAELFYVSPNYYSTMFKQESGSTTVNYIKELRLKKACEYLRSSDRSIADISKEVGYEDSQYFFRVFKKSIGLTPLDYRKSHRKK